MTHADTWAAMVDDARACNAAMVRDGAKQRTTRMWQTLAHLAKGPCTANEAWESTGRIGSNSGAQKALVAFVKCGQATRVQETTGARKFRYTITQAGIDALAEWEAAQ